MHYQRLATIAPSTAWCIRLCSVHKLFRNVSSSRSGCLRQTTMSTRHRMAKQTSRRNRRQKKKTQKIVAENVHSLAIIIMCAMVWAIPIAAGNAETEYKCFWDKKKKNLKKSHSILCIFFSLFLVPSWRCHVAIRWWCLCSSFFNFVFFFFSLLRLQRMKDICCTILSHTGFPIERSARRWRRPSIEQSFSLFRVTCIRANAWARKHSVLLCDGETTFAFETCRS